MDNDNSSGGASQQAMGVIYKITNTLNGKPYVGQTQRQLKVRIHKHKYGNLYIDKVIQKHGWEGNFTVEVLEECATIEQLNAREKFWIAELNSKVPNGYNLTDGGLGHVGRSPSKETRAKISVGNKGKKRTKETRAKIAAAMKGKSRKPHSKETRAKISVAQTGKKISPETCAKISAANKASGRKPPDRTGKKHTSETKAKISAANKGKKRSLETRAKISAARKGKKNPFYGKHHSEETLAKMRESHARRKKAVENGDNK